MPTLGEKTIDWYQNRHELRPGQVFRTEFDGIVRLERSVPGDATKWYVADWNNGWFIYDSTIEPGDLVELIAADISQTEV